MLCRAKNILQVSLSNAATSLTVENDQFRQVVQIDRLVYDEVQQT